jgi:hypothetical protein
MAPLRIVVLIAVPNTISEPRDSVAPLALPPEATNSCPPLITTVPLAVPPASAICNPPLLTCAPFATPWSSSMPPLLMVVLTAMPCTTSKPPAESVAPLAVPPMPTNSCAFMPLMTAPLASEPDTIVASIPPLLTCAPSALP